MSDIGRAEDAAEEQRASARLNGQPAVVLIVSKQSGQNTVAVAEAVKARLAEIIPTLPHGVRVEVAGDQSIFIKAAVESIKTHLIEGSLLASLVVLIFLWNIRLTLIAAIAIPTSIIATFGAMAAMGYTLNQITMLALTLMVGIVIDDAIVVLENIYRFVEEKGMSPFQAAVEGTREIGLAVMTTTLSLIAVFLPVGFMGGIVGRFMSSFGLTSSFAIGISLIVSFTLTPMLCARLINRHNRSTAEESGGHAESSSKQSRFYRPIDQTYMKLLHLAMGHRKTVVLLSLLIVVSIVPLFKFIGKNFLPVDDESQFEIAVQQEQQGVRESLAGRLITSCCANHPTTFITLGGWLSLSSTSAGFHTSSRLPQYPFTYSFTRASNCTTSPGCNWSAAKARVRLNQR
ncbi:MAG: efflux RND transporter permease subunit [Candidatus Tectomicrobia bacterium]|nr:efflux RND transporter permease subunit [Candidatus Tectomicrobia bacterium]